MAADIEVTVQLQQWIGQAIAIAGNFVAPDGTTHRDSKPADRRLRVMRAKEVQPTPRIALPVAAVPPRQRWVDAVRGRSIVEASLRHDSHRVIVAGSVAWCDRCGAYAETRGRGLARPCRGPVTGGNRVGRPLKDVQARLRALRAGRHPTTKVVLDTGRHSLSGAGAQSSRSSDRSRSVRRTNACSNLIAAINGEVPAPQGGAANGACTSASTRRSGRLAHAAATRHASLCQLLIAAASADGAAALDEYADRNGGHRYMEGMSWSTTGLAAVALAAVMVALISACCVQLARSFYCKHMEASDGIGEFAGRSCVRWSLSSFCGPADGRTCANGQLLRCAAGTCGSSQHLGDQRRPRRGMERLATCSAPVGGHEPGVRTTRSWVSPGTEWTAAHNTAGDRGPCWQSDAWTGDAAVPGPPQYHFDDPDDVPLKACEELGVTPRSTCGARDHGMTREVDEQEAAAATVHSWRWEAGLRGRTVPQA